LKDWAYLTTVEEMEQATNSLLENGSKVGADSWQQRVKNQTPHKVDHHYEAPLALLHGEEVHQ